MHRKCVVLTSRTIKTLISNWPRTRKFSQLYTGGKAVDFDFSHHSFALIGQNLTGEFMWITIYAAPGNLLLIAEADWVMCHLVMFLIVFFFFPLDVQNELQLLSRFFCYSWLICFLGFWLRKSKSSEIRFRMVSFSKLTLLDAYKRVKKSQEILAFLVGFRELHLYR